MDTQIFCENKSFLVICNLQSKWENIKSWNEKKNRWKNKEMELLSFNLNW